MNAHTSTNGLRGWKLWGDNCPAQLSRGLRFLSCGLRPAKRVSMVRKSCGQYLHAYAIFLSMIVAGVFIEDIALGADFSPEAVQKRIDEQRTLNRRNRIKGNPVPRIADSLPIGDFGTLPGSLRVVTVIGPNEMLCESSINTVRYAPGIGTLTPVNKVSRKSVIVRAYKTEGLTTDSVFKVSDTVKISGTTDYVTELGIKQTLLVIEPIDLNPYFNKKSSGKSSASANGKPKDQSSKTSPLKPTDKGESAAGSKLRLAKQFLESGKEETGKKWLQEIVDEFPGTAAAAEANDILKK